MSMEMLDIIPPLLRSLMNIREIFKDEKNNCLRIVLESNPEVLTIHGEPHGGYLSMITMIAAEIAATSLLTEEGVLVFINHSLNFLKHVEAYDQELEINSCILSRGERIIYIETYVRCKGEDITQAISSFIAEKSS